MFSQFRNPVAKGKKVADDQLFCLSAEFRKIGKSASDNEDALFMAVTNGLSAWIALIRDEEFQNLVNNCRLGSFESFRSHTVNALNQAKPVEGAEYILEAKITRDGEELEIKWKLRQSGISQLIGQVQLFKSSSPAEVNFRLIQSALSSASVSEYQSSLLKKQSQELTEAENMWNTLRTMPDFSQQITERTVEILNDAKRRNRELGGSTEGFTEAWQHATQHVENMETQQ